MALGWRYKGRSLEIRFKGKWDLKISRGGDRCREGSGPPRDKPLYAPAPKAVIRHHFPEGPAVTKGLRDGQGKRTSLWTT